VKRGLSIFLGVGALALAAAPQAVADPPTLVSPEEGASFTARADQITFQASTTASPGPSVMDFYVSKGTSTDSNGVLSNWIEHIQGDPTGGDPEVYESGPGSDASWPNRPGTYYWQAVYDDCTTAPPSCIRNESGIQSLTVDPLPPPTQISPADGATIPFGGQMTFTVQDPPAYSPDGTTPLYIEFAKGNDRLDPDGTFANADHYFSAEALSAGGNSYEYQLTPPFSDVPGTYYWIVERFDCLAEQDCYVTNDAIRSFTITPQDSGGGPAPNTLFTRHPKHRTHRHRVTFAFSSDVDTASFQCFYTQGWSHCRSPQRFRHLKPGRYRFKARAVANGMKDPTPASWFFKVVRRARSRH
jgi:hypothetical protein